MIIISLYFPLLFTASIDLGWLSFNYSEIKVKTFLGHSVVVDLIQKFFCKWMFGLKKTDEVQKWTPSPCIAFIADVCFFL